MLKKITIISGILLCAALLASLLMLPTAARDFLKNGERMLDAVLTSTPVATFDGKSYSTVRLNVGGMPIYVEASGDDNIYLRVEGLYADRQKISSTELSEDGASVLLLSLGDRDAFFDTSSSYLFRRLLLTENNLSSAVLRIPEYVRIETEYYPGMISYGDGVQFANRSYYDYSEWRNESARGDPIVEEDFSQEEEPLPAVPGNPATRGELLRERFSTMNSAFIMELETALAVADGSGKSSVSRFDGQADEIVTRSLQEMSEQIFPYSSQVYDKTTLTNLLQKYLELTGEEAKQRARLETGYYDNQDEAIISRAQENYEKLHELTQTAQNLFLEKFNRYIETVDGPVKSNQLVRIPAEEHSSSESVPEDSPETEESSIPPEPEAPSDVSSSIAAAVTVPST